MAAQTVADSVTVIVFAGNVYVPGVGQVVTSGVGTAQMEVLVGSDGVT